MDWCKGVSSFVGSTEQDRLSVRHLKPLTVWQVGVGYGGGRFGNRFVVLRAEAVWDEGGGYVEEHLKSFTVAW